MWIYTSMRAGEKSRREFTLSCNCLDASADSNPAALPGVLSSAFLEADGPHSVYTSVRGRRKNSLRKAASVLARREICQPGRYGLEDARAIVFIPPRLGLGR